MAYSLAISGRSNVSLFAMLTPCLALVRLLLGVKLKPQGHSCIQIMISFISPFFLPGWGHLSVLGREHFFCFPTICTWCHTHPNHQRETMLRLALFFLLSWLSLFYTVAEPEVVPRSGCNGQCIDQRLGPLLSRGASISHDTSTVARWSDFDAPRPGAIVNVATEKDVLTTVRTTLTIDVSPQFNTIHANSGRSNSATSTILPFLPKTAEMVGQPLFILVRKTSLST